MKEQFFHGLGKNLITLLFFNLTSWAAIYGKDLETFSIQKSPSPGDWQSFLSSSSIDRKELWHYNHQRGTLLKDWAWEWRLAWIKTCIVDSSPYCSDIFTQALFDQAAVVRGEAALLLGKRFSNSKNPLLLSTLKKAYAHQMNYKKGKPSFVQVKILDAIRRIQGELAVNKQK